MPLYDRKSKKDRGTKKHSINILLSAKQREVAQIIANTYFRGSYGPVLRVALNELGMNLGIFKRSEREVLCREERMQGFDRFEKRLKNHGWSELAPDYEI